MENHNRQVDLNMMEVVKDFMRQKGLLRLKYNKVCPLDFYKRVVSLHDFYVCDASSLSYCYFSHNSVWDNTVVLNALCPAGKTLTLGGLAV